MEAEAEFFQRKAVCCKVDRNTETVIVQFFDRTGVILETPELFTKAYLNHMSDAHICIFAPVHELVDDARTMGFGPILLR